ncbi:hypothetical protein K456DRAFT_31549 [Colletotrichum gloeosporioides 23]|nr:hypothetical protein K456DRAFT_31549 [Colletotrichum gloeosporioides 23]
MFNHAILLLFLQLTAAIHRLSTADHCTSSWTGLLGPDLQQLPVFHSKKDAYSASARFALVLRSSNYSNQKAGPGAGARWNRPHNSALVGSVTIAVAPEMNVSLPGFNNFAELSEINNRLH